MAKKVAALARRHAGQPEQEIGDKAVESQSRIALIRPLIAARP
jgi:hypothetical protein